MKSIYLIPIVLLFFSCKCMKTEDSSKNNLFTTLYSSQTQGKEEESNVVITNQKDLEALYNSVNKNEVPKIDFSKNQVVALFLGMRNTGGYNISVDRVEEEKNQIIIYKKIERPAPGAMATMAITNPMVIVKINSKKDIIFK